MITKPICFSYREYVELREAYKQLLEDNQTLMVDNRDLRKKVQHQAKRVNKLLEENTNLKISKNLLLMIMEDDDEIHSET